MAVEADLSDSLTEIVVGMVVLITSAIEIIKELIVFIRYKISKLGVFGVAITKRVKKSVKVIK
jgi:hypothetical protein